jgi:hypothetical protein
MSGGATEGESPLRDDHAQGSAAGGSARAPGGESAR